MWRTHIICQVQQVPNEKKSMRSLSLRQSLSLSLRLSLCLRLSRQVSQDAAAAHIRRVAQEAPIGPRRHTAEGVKMPKPPRVNVDYPARKPDTPPPPHPVTAPKATRHSSSGEHPLAFFRYQVPREIDFGERRAGGERKGQC
jgi:hypothetical protein